MATFTAPERLATDPQSMLWMLPLVAAIAVIYKATKMPTIAPALFFKETAALFGSIVVFIIVTALVLFALVWLMAL
ncbi:MAG: hypothetical protein JSV99_12320 [Planctomycetota bacterium]|nr:MAG: hypothetical protein JSV99_12320 [Planctomycetota bacterium]